MVQVARPLLSKHPRVLRDTGAVTATISGKRRVYRLAVDSPLTPSALSWASIDTSR